MTKRASGELEKNERRSEILARADELFRDRAFDEIKMTDLAQALALAKGTLYLYFPSKESLFLALLVDRLDAAFGTFFAEIEAASDRGSDALSPRVTVESVAAGTAAVLAADLTLPRLLAIMHTVLESRLPFEEAVAFKRRLASSLRDSGAHLAQVLPPLSEEEGRRYFLYLYAQVVGLVSLTDISPFMKKICAEPGLEMFRFDFRESLQESARALLAGILKEGDKR